MYYLQHEKTGEYVAAIIKLRGGDNAYAVYFGPNPSVPSWKTQSAAQKALDRLLDCEYTNPRGVALDLIVVDPEEKEEVAHMNEMTTAQAATPARSLLEIETEIRHQKNVIGEGYVKIGLALIEAKKQLQHGEWAEWLRDRVKFSQSSAEGYMRVAREYGSGSQLLNLPYTKVLALLAVPAEERESFAEANNAQDKSVAEIKRLIREKEEAEKHARSIESTLSASNAKNYHLKNEIETLKQQLKKERAKEPDTVTVEKEVPPADYEAVKAQNTKLEEQLRTAMIRLNQAEDSLEEAEERVRSAQAEAQRASMARIDENEQDESDPLSVIPFSSACLRFTGSLHAAQFSAEYFAGKSADDLRRYRLMADTVLAWARNTLKALDEAEGRRVIGGEDVVVA